MTDLEMAEAAIREAEELLRDVDEHLGDEPHPSEGGSHATLELRQRIKAFLTHDPRASV